MINIESETNNTNTINVIRSKKVEEEDNVKQKKANYIFMIRWTTRRLTTIQIESKENNEENRIMKDSDRQQNILNMGLVTS